MSYSGYRGTTKSICPPAREKRNCFGKSKQRRLHYRLLSGWHCCYCGFQLSLWFESHCFDPPSCCLGFANVGLLLLTLLFGFWGSNINYYLDRHIGLSVHLSVPLKAPKIWQSSIYYTGLLGRWDERLIDQASDVPSIIFFFKISCKILCKNRFNFHDFTKIKIKSFECPKSIRNYEKKIMLGTSDAWSTRRSSQRPSVLYWRMSVCLQFKDLSYIV